MLRRESWLSGRNSIIQIEIGNCKVASTDMVFRVKVFDLTSSVVYFIKDPVPQERLPRVFIVNSRVDALFFEGSLLTNLKVYLERDPNKIVNILSICQADGVTFSTNSSLQNLRSYCSNHSQSNTEQRQIAGHADGRLCRPGLKPSFEGRRGRSTQAAGAGGVGHAKRLRDESRSQDFLQRVNMAIPRHLS